MNYWESRLFKNTFTYKGKSKPVRGWAVKMQLSGRRKTFALRISDRYLAATEACHIYQTIRASGWDALKQRREIGTHSRSSSGVLDAGATLSIEHWKPRLIQRRYPEPTPKTPREWSVHIEHAGVRRYFPLGTTDEARGAAEAMRIYQTIVGQGWAVASQHFPCELTLAMRWLEDPLAWTYTTIQTHRNCNDAREHGGNAGGANTIVIEPDLGIRNALRTCINQQANFKCVATYSSAGEAEREITRRRVDFVVVNYALPDQSGASCLDTLQKLRPVAGLLFSVYEDSDELFRATPGGAGGYLLKRTPAHRLFEPILEIGGSLVRETIAARIREYFQRLIAAMPSGPSALATAKLTPREHEILGLLAKGNLAKEIADALGISIWTVHGHIKSIFEKLGVHTRTEAVVKFLQK